MKRPVASKGSSSRSKLVRLMKLPIRALSRARDYYVRSMVDCTQMSRCPGAHGIGALQRSVSVAGSSIVLDMDDRRGEDYRELVRAASLRTLQACNSGNRIRMVGRSATMGMGRIDEEKPSEVDEDLDDDDTRRLRVDDGENGGRKQSSVMVWRSKSYAPKTKGVLF